MATPDLAPLLFVDMTEIHTKRLILRHPMEADAPPLVARLNDFEVSKWLSQVPYPYTRADADDWIQLCKTDMLKLNFSILLDGDLIGGVGLTAQREESHELGYWLSRDCWGFGFATEAATALVDYGITKRKLATIVATYFVGNDTSAKILSKLGFETSGNRKIFSKSRNEEVEAILMKLNR